MTATAQRPTDHGVAGTTWGPVMTRVGGLPADAVDLVGPRTAQLVDRLDHCERLITQAAPSVVDVLYSLVPHIDEVPLRRAVLAAKRSAHHGDDLPCDDAVAEAIACRLPSAAAGEVASYRALCVERSELGRLLESEITADHQRSVGALYDLLDDDRYLASLAVAAPDWLAHAKPRHRRPGTVAAVKTLYSYAVRASLKTSPFSGLTTVAAAGVRGSGRRQTQPSLVLAARALSTLARDPRTARLLRFRLAPWRPGGADAPSGLLLRAENLMADGIVWRHDRVVAADHALPWLDALSGLDEPFTLDDLLARLDAEEPFCRYLRLLETGLVRAVAPWRRGEPALLALARLTHGEPSPVSDSDLRRVHLTAHSVAAGDADARTRDALQIQQLTRTWGDLADLGTQTTSGSVYEDCESDLLVTDPMASASVRADLESLADLVRPYVFRSHVYDHIVRAFVAEHGSGGVCGDPLGFLMRLSVERDVDLPLQQAHAADLAQRGRTGERAWLPVGLTSAPPAAGALVQLATGSGQTTSSDDDHLLVVNHFTAGSGALSARFTSLLPPSFTDRLRHFVRSAWPGAPCRELLVWTDCNNAQAQCGGLLPPLLVPGEPDDPRGLDLAATRLVHDPADDTVSLTDRTGEPFGLAYLGLTPQHLLQGYLRLLATIANPWINGAQASDYTPTMAHDLVPACRDDVVHLPRQVHGRVVTRRASWVVPVDQLGRPASRRCGPTELMAMHRLRLQHGLPDEVFVHQLGAGPAALLGDAHKPTWLAFASSVSLESFWQWLSPDTTHVRVVEALPSRLQHLQRDRDGRPRVTEHATFVHWARPEARA